MANKTALECANQLLQFVTNSNEPFGNKTFVGLGDFRQVAPVVRHSGPSAVFHASVKSSNLWPLFHILHSTQPIRDSGDLSYSAWVDSIGEGSSSETISLVDISHLQQLYSFEEAAEFLFLPNILTDPTHAIQ